MSGEPPPPPSYESHTTKLPLDNPNQSVYHQEQQSYYQQQQQQQPHLQHQHQPQHQQQEQQPYYHRQEHHYQQEQAYYQQQQQPQQALDYRTSYISQHDQSPPLVNNTNSYTSAHDSQNMYPTSYEEQPPDYYTGGHEPAKGPPKSAAPGRPPSRPSQRPQQRPGSSALRSQSMAAPSTQPSTASPQTGHCSQGVLPRAPKVPTTTSSSAPSPTTPNRPQNRPQELKLLTRNLFDKKFIRSEPTVLVMSETLGIFSSKTKKVKDLNKRVMFNIPSPKRTDSKKQMINDGEGFVPVVTLKRQKGVRGMFSNIQVIMNPTTLEKLAKVETKKFSSSKTFAEVYYYSSDGSEREAMAITGNYYQKTFNIYTAEKVLIASANKKSKIFGKDAYALTIQPGVDVAFIISIMVAVDKIFHN